MRSILITGVTGCGKSTLTLGASRALNVRSRDYADLMLEVSPALGNKDAIEHLSMEERLPIYGAVTDMLGQWFGPANLSTELMLLENHLSIVQDGRVVAFSTDAYSRYNAIGLVAIAAAPEVILARRLSDSNRNRRPGTVDEIAEQQRVNEERARIVSGFLDVPLLLLDNVGGVTEQVATLTRWILELAT